MAKAVKIENGANELYTYTVYIGETFSKSVLDINTWQRVHVGHLVDCISIKNGFEKAGYEDLTTV